MQINIPMVIPSSNLEAAFQRLSDKFPPDELSRKLQWLQEDIFDGMEEFDERLWEECISRLEAGEPVQYITGVADFYGLRLKIDHRALIPRPETEELVQWCVEICKAKGNTSPKVLDLCTGSGCIALAVKNLLPQSEVWGVDLSEGALALARENGDLLGLVVNWVQADVLGEWDFQPNSFDVIISNPPYITYEERGQMDDSVVEHEPEMALFVNQGDAAEFYANIASKAGDFLKKGGILLFELNSLQAGHIKLQVEQTSSRPSAIKKDMSGNERMLLVVF